VLKFLQLFDKTVRIQIGSVLRNLDPHTNTYGHLITDPGPQHWKYQRRIRISTLGQNAAWTRIRIQNFLEMFRSPPFIMNTGTGITATFPDLFQDVIYL